MSSSLQDAGGMFINGEWISITADMYEEDYPPDEDNDDDEDDVHTPVESEDDSVPDEEVWESEKEAPEIPGPSEPSRTPKRRRVHQFRQHWLRPWVVSLLGLISDLTLG